jgi:hypothetical protein
VNGKYITNFKRGIGSLSAYLPYMNTFRSGKEAFIAILVLDKHEWCSTSTFVNKINNGEINSTFNFVFFHGEIPSFSTFSMRERSENG